MRYPAALAIVRERVKPERDGNARTARRIRWWRFGENAVGMRQAIGPLPRYIAGGAQGKHLFFCWCTPDWCPSNLTNVFAFADPYSFGVLSSVVHELWARRGEGKSTLEDRPRYTPSTVFETFPWPNPPVPLRVEIGSIADEIETYRRELCLADGIGLTRLYNKMDEGAYEELRRFHATLDTAVAAAYGWSSSILRDHEVLLQELVRLNFAITAGKQPYDPFPASQRDTFPGARQLRIEIDA